MKFSRAFPRVLAAKDVTTPTVKVIAKYEQRMFAGDNGGGQEQKWVLHFTDKTSARLNATNGNRIVEACGDDMDDWVGAELLLDVVQTNMGPGIRMTPRRAIKPKAEEDKQLPLEVRDDVIPF